MPEAERKLELELSPVGPWHAIVRVTAIATNHGRNSSLPHDWLFEIGVEWFGPPAPLLPPSERWVQSHDAYVVHTLEEAYVIARKAAEGFRKGGESAPDLRDLAAAK